MSAPGWYPDPHGEHQFRYWDGEAWTDHVHDEVAPASPTLAAPATPAVPAPTMPAAPAMPAGSPPPPARPAPDLTGGTHSALAWIVALAIVVVVFVVAFFVAKAVTKDDSSSGASSDLPAVTPIGGVSLPGITLPAGITVPDLTLPPAVTLPPGVTLPADATVPSVVVPLGTAGETQAVSVTGAPLPPVSPDGSDPAIGTPAPQLVGASFDGTPVVVGPGAPTLVLFLAHWCPHCQAEVPRLVSWFQSGQVPAGVNVVGVATATAAERENFPPSAWLAAAGFPWPVLADSPAYDAAAAFGVDAFPYFVMYDAAGNVLFRASGEIEMDALTAQITAALG